jgi:hypothetical protein
MFGYRLIKETEIKDLRSKLADAKEIIAKQSKQIVDDSVKIAELNNKIKEQEEYIANLTANAKSDVVDEKPVKKVRRKSSKKTTKKEE